eukprot:PhM_4_TR3185/c0_g1_i1/m.58962
MHSLLTSTVRGAVSATTKPYAQCVRKQPLAMMNKKTAVGGPSYAKGSLTTAAMVPGVLATYVLPIVLSPALTNVQQYGRSIAAQGLFQSEVARVAAAIHTLESVVALEPCDDRVVQDAVDAFVVQEARRVVAGVLVSAYGVDVERVARPALDALLRDLTALSERNPETFAKLTEHALALKNKSGDSSRSSNTIAHVDPMLGSDVSKLVGSITRLGRAGKVEPSTLGHAATRLWGGAVSLCRTTDSFDRECASAHHEWVLSTRYVTKTCLEVDSELAWARVQGSASPSQAAVEAMVDGVLNPLDAPAPKLAPLPRPQAEEEAAAQE